MTLKEAKDIIAAKYGHGNWEAWGYAVSEPSGHSIPEQYQTEAAELYAAFKRATDISKQLFLDQFVWGRSIYYRDGKTGEVRVIDPTSEEASNLFMGLSGGAENV